MDRASQVLAEGVPEGIPNTYSAIAAHGEVPLSTLHHRARGRRSREAKAQSQQYLTPCEENAVVEFLLHMTSLGTPVRMKYIASIAFSATRHRARADRPQKPPGVNWAKALERRRPEIVARKKRAQDWSRLKIHDKVSQWFVVVEPELRKVEPWNAYNMDETGVMLSMPNSVKVLVGKDDMRSSCRGARVKRTTVTAIECVSADGRCLNPMIVWPASTHRANWTTFPTPGWVYATSETGFSDSYISLQWLKLVFDPQTKERAGGKPRLLIWDGFGTHETLEILEFCFENNIIVCRLPSHTSHELQPCDVALFGPLKTAYRGQVERMERGGVNTIGKQHFTYLYSPAREIALTKRNILAGWRGSGLFPFNPNRVLANIPKPPPSPVELTIPKDDVAPVPSRYEAMPTPATPKTGEDLTRLLAMIEHIPKENNDETSNEHKERLRQKVSHAAQTFLAKNALLRDHNNFLMKINDESKTRRATKSTILGKARVMTYEDLEKARQVREEKVAKKAAKEAREAITGKKRGRPRKDTVDTPAPKAKKARIRETDFVEGQAGPSKPKANIVRGEAQAAEGEAGSSELRAKAIQRSTAQAIEAIPSKPKPQVRQRSQTQVAEGEAGPSKPKANAVSSEVQAIDGEPGKPKLRALAVQRNEPQIVEAVTSKANPQVIQRSEAQVAKGHTGPLKPKAKVIAEADANISAPTARVVAEGHAGPSKPKAIAQTTPQIKKVRIVPRPWRAPEARMF